MVHGLLLALAFGAILFAARSPLRTNAATLPEPPAFAFSGVVGAATATHDTYLRPTVSHDTLESSIQTKLVSDVQGLRATSAIQPSSAFSAGVVAASTAATGGGVTALADLIDPQKPYYFYKTKAGDSLSRIAQTYGLAIASVLDNNPTVTDADAIQPNQELLIPRTDGILHIVSYGETLASIISQYDDVTSDDVLAYSANQLASASDIQSGQYVLLPGASVKPPPPPPQPVSSPSGSTVTGPPPPQGDGLFDYPLAAWGMVSDEFGTYRGPGRFHTGIDLAGISSAPVYAACDGTVTTTQWLTYSYGYHVIISCAGGGGWTTLYAHFSEILVVEGQYVTSGTPVGITGVTGYTTGEHLHFEIRQNGTYYDPSAYLNFY